ncbi:hypothetical protein ACFQE0_03030 [Methylobacterium komagatae]|uniref:Flagellar biosynthesis protein FliO n=1 Tax=Methylobacterium komagatae TaxID=374425 RepID=A0ABW2BFD2_9HYPH
MFGSDGSPIIQYLVIFAIIFSALAAIVLVVRRLTGSGSALPGRSGRARQPRLGIVDVYELDRARQLILLRRDNVEHLLLVGGPNDVVVERNIQRGQRPLSEPALRAEPAAEPLPDPLAEAGRLPEPPRALAEPGRSLGEPPFRRPEPTFEMPVVVPPPVPGSNAAPPVRLPLDVALIDGDEPGRDIPEPPPSPASQPEPPVLSPPAGSVREALMRPRTLRTSAPVLDRKPVAEKVDETVKLPSAGMVLPPLTPPPVETRPVDPVVLSDMARQLQAAISRPSSAAAPPPPPPTPAPAAPAPEPPPAAPKPEPQPSAPAAPPPIDPIAAAMAALVPPSIDPIAAGMAAAKAEPEANTSTEPPRPARTEKKVASAKAEPKSPGNPFSVEEIEAEFARLLGRPLDKRN